MEAQAAELAKKFDRMADRLDGKLTEILSTLKKQQRPAPAQRISARDQEPLNLQGPAALENITLESCAVPSPTADATPNTGPVLDDDAVQSPTAESLTKKACSPLQEELQLRPIKKNETLLDGARVFVCVGNHYGELGKYGTVVGTKIKGNFYDVEVPGLKDTVKKRASSLRQCVPDESSPTKKPFQKMWRSIWKKNKNPLNETSESS